MVSTWRHNYDANFYKQLLSDFEQEFKIKSKEYSKFIANKKASILMTIIYGLCNEATKTRINLGGTYKIDCQDGNLIELLKQALIVCFRSNDGGLSFGHYNQVVVVKLMNNYSNNKPHNPHGFKEEV